MALDLGELSIRLELDNDIARGLAQAKREVETLPPTVQREMVKVAREMDKGGRFAGQTFANGLVRDASGRLRNAQGRFASDAEIALAGLSPAAEKQGRKTGGKLAQGINQGLIRNSPLIVAGVGAALAAGAPLMTAAAGALFGGVGAVAAAQTLEVRAAWTNLGRDIRDSAVEDAAVLVPVYTEMADKIGGAFRDMRPELRDAFADSAPLIRSTTDGIIALATNAMPGLTRSIAGAGPVFEGFERFLAQTGQGLGDFFDALTDNSPAAGEAFASIGDLMGDLLPILGELLGQGAELASAVLPAVTAATGLTLDVLQLLGPILPQVVAGFVAFKAAQAAAGYLQTFAVQAQYATIAATGSVTAGERVGGAMSKVADGVGRASAALPVLGIVLSGISSNLSDATSEEERWAQAILAGGQAAVKAYEEYKSGTHWGQSIDEATGLASSWDEAKAKADEMRDAMTPLQRAQTDVTAATNFLNEQVAKYGPTSNEAAGASRVLESAQASLERQQASLELATHGVTAAMLEQANQALAAIDSGFAYRNSVDGLEDAQATLAETIRNRTNADKDLRTSEEDVARAQLAVEEQSYRTALAFGQQQADLSGLSRDSSEYARIVQTETLAKLYELQSAAGPEMKAAIGQQIAALEASGVKLGTTGAAAATTAQRMKDLGVQVTQVPGNRTIFIDAPTADQKRRIEELGLRVMTLPNGRIYVTADTSPAEGTLAWFLNQRRSIQIRANIVAGTGYQGMGQQPRAATGGRVGEVVRGFSGGGKLNGPGTPTSDSIPALTYSGAPLRVSDEEWVIQARAANMYGDDRMAAINAGTALVAVPGRGLAGGGPVTQTGATAVLDRGVDRPWVHADTINIIDGTPSDVAQQLAYKLRTEGRG